jgi:hypothetical protein
MTTIESLQQQINALNQFWSTLKMQLERDMKTVMSNSSGGAGSIVQLDLPVRTITQSTNITRNDYYIGVNSNDQVTISLPITGVYPGRTIVVKDEKGNAQNVPIKISGIIDNDPEGVEMRINYGSLTFIYNNGWRVI